MTTQETVGTSGRRPIDTFPLRLRIARVHAGDVSIEVAAQRCGVKPATWSTWERGVHTPPHLAAIARVIADGLDVDEEWLLNGGPLDPPPGPTDPEGAALHAIDGDSGGTVRAKRRRLVYRPDISVDKAA